MITRHGNPRRRSAILFVIVGGALALAVGTCAVLLSQLNFGDKKAEHSIPLAGAGPLTEEQAVTLSQQVLELDGRDVADLTLWDAGVGSPATRVTATDGDQPRGDIRRGDTGDGSVQVTYRHRRTRWWWYVVLRREPGRVVGFSYHGI